MGEVANMSMVLETEVAKLVGYLPARADAPATAHEAHMRHHKTCVTIAETIAHYEARLPPYASVPLLLRFGETLAYGGRRAS